MSNLEVFRSEEFGEVRTVTIGGEAWFVGKDVAEALGYERGAKAIQDHVDTEDKDAVPIRDSIGRMQRTPVVNESGLYALVFSSKLESAKRFKKWVTSDVLPAIRKTGAYSMQEMSPQLQLLINMEAEQRRQARELTEVQNRIDGIRDVVSLGVDAWRGESSSLLNKIAQMHGGEDAFKQVRAECYELLEQRMGVDLHRRLVNKRRRMADEGICKSKRDRIGLVDVIAADKKLIEGYMAIVKEMVVRYGAA